MAANPRRLYIDLSLCNAGSLNSSSSFSSSGSLSSGSLPALELSPEDSHYVSNVLRLRPGNEVHVFDRKGSCGPFLARLTGTGETATIELVETIDWPAVAQPVKSISLGLCKGERNDLVVQKATELSVPHINLWQASRSVVRLDSKTAQESRRNRWARIAESAAEQSGQAILPEIALCQNASELMELLGGMSCDDNLRLCCSLSKGARELHDSVRKYSEIHLIIGPEGDLSPEEESLFAEHGFCFVTLGPAVLRSETAAIVAIAMVQALWKAL